MSALTDIASVALTYHQNNQATATHTQHIDEVKQIQQKTLEEVMQMHATVKGMGLQFHAMQPMQPAMLQPMQPLMPPTLVMPTTTTAPETKATATAPYSRYAPDMDVSVSCVPCTRAHLTTIAGAAKKAVNGDADALAAARKEMAALMEYDLTPEKLAVTPERDRQVLAKYAGQIAELQADLAGPAPDITTATASLEEAMRFARADGVDHPEAQLRIARAEELIDVMERVQFSPSLLRQYSPEEQQAIKAALPELRAARQDLVNNVHSADDLEEVTARIAEIDKQLNPAPDPDQVYEVLEKAVALNDSFRKDVLVAWKGK